MKSLILFFIAVQTILIGTEAETLAHNLNLPALPVAQPNSEQEVLKFLSDPDKVGTMPVPVAVAADAPKSLKSGVPEAWLVGGLQDGLAGVSIFGLDTETVLRPNPEQPYLSLQMMGGQMQAWRVAATQANGSADIEANTRHTYGWSRGSGYAQLYLHVDQPTETLLHLQQSGIKTAIWQDGQPVKLTDDPKPPTALSERLEASQVAALTLAQGWHSLLVKLVMQHEQGQRFYFAGLFTNPAGQALDSIKTQLTDPDVDLALNKIGLPT
ncbi:MAG: hypothetical protein WCS87_16365 [Methylococcaceae bacterium]